MTYKSVYDKILTLKILVVDVQRTARNLLLFRPTVGTSEDEITKRKDETSFYV